jgi:hypothetical protein
MIKMVTFTTKLEAIILLRVYIYIYIYNITSNNGIIKLKIK